jgi:UDP-N-acetylmuramoyl-tripeptide--D-alanyl-D-alanine ligase
VATPGALFLAIEAERDGHAFIGDARARGAVGVLARKVVGDPAPGFAYVIVPDPVQALQRVARAHRQQLEMGIVGVTGSVGKTSTKEAMAQVLRHRYRVLASPGNFNNEIGLPIALLEADASHERAVLEMGAYRMGEIAQLCSVALPEVGVVTTVGPNHLESFGSMENIEKGKGELVEALPPTGLAILNGDDERVRRMAARAACPVVLYGTGKANVVRAVDVETRGLHGIAFSLITPGGSARIETPLIGRHNVYPCLAAAAVGLADDFSPREIAEALAGGGERLRLRPLPGRNGATVLDDSYNAAPISVLAALDVLAEHDGRRVAILGDMLELGEVEAEGHRRVGERAAKAADLLIAVGARGRMIGQAAEVAGLRDVRYAESGDAVDFQPAARDLVLVKASHGMRLDRVVERLVEPGSAA